MKIPRGKLHQGTTNHGVRKSGIPKPSLVSKLKRSGGGKVTKLQPSAASSSVCKKKTSNRINKSTTIAKEENSRKTISGAGVKVKEIQVTTKEKSASDAKQSSKVTFLKPSAPIKVEADSLKQVEPFSYKRKTEKETIKSKFNEQQEFSEEFEFQADSEALKSILNNEGITANFMDTNMSRSSMVANNTLLMPDGRPSLCRRVLVRPSVAAEARASLPGPRRVPTTARNGPTAKVRNSTIGKSKSFVPASFARHSLYNVVQGRYSNHQNMDNPRFSLQQGKKQQQAKSPARLCNKLTATMKTPLTPMRVLRKTERISASPALRVPCSVTTTPLPGRGKMKPKTKQRAITWADEKSPQVQDKLAVHLFGESPGQLKTYPKTPVSILKSKTRRETTLAPISMDGGNPAYNDKDCEIEIISPTTINTLVPTPEENQNDSCETIRKEPISQERDGKNKNTIKAIKKEKLRSPDTNGELVSSKPKRTEPSSKIQNHKPTNTSVSLKTAAKPPLSSQNDTISVEKVLNLMNEQLMRVKRRSVQTELANALQVVTKSLKSGGASECVTISEDNETTEVQQSDAISPQVTNVQNEQFEIQLQKSQGGLSPEAVKKLRQSFEETNRSIDEIALETERINQELRQLQIDREKLKLSRPQVKLRSETSRPNGRIPHKESQLQQQNRKEIEFSPENEPENGKTSSFLKTSPMNSSFPRSKSPMNPITCQEYCPPPPSHSAFNEKSTPPPHTAPKQDFTQPWPSNPLTIPASALPYPSNTNTTQDITQPWPSNPLTKLHSKQDLTQPSNSPTSHKSTPPYMPKIASEQDITQPWPSNPSTRLDSTPQDPSTKVCFTPPYLPNTNTKQDLTQSSNSPIGHDATPPYAPKIAIRPEITVPWPSNPPTGQNFTLQYPFTKLHFTPPYLPNTDTKQEITPKWPSNSPMSHDSTPPYMPKIAAKQEVTQPWSSNPPTKPTSPPQYPLHLPPKLESTPESANTSLSPRLIMEQCSRPLSQTLNDFISPVRTGSPLVHGAQHDSPSLTSTEVNRTKPTSFSTSETQESKNSSPSTLTNTGNHFSELFDKFRKEILSSNHKESSREGTKISLTPESMKLNSKNNVKSDTKQSLEDISVVKTRISRTSEPVNSNSQIFENTPETLPVLPTFATTADTTEQTQSSVNETGNTEVLFQPLNSKNSQNQFHFKNTNEDKENLTYNNNYQEFAPATPKVLNPKPILPFEPQTPFAIRELRNAYQSSLRDGVFRESPRSKMKSQFAHALLDEEVSLFTCRVVRPPLATKLTNPVASSLSVGDSQHFVPIQATPKIKVKPKNSAFSVYNPR